jgi:hypothetical protein
LLVVSLYSMDFPVAETVLIYASLVGIGVHFVVEAVVGAIEPAVRDEWRFVARVKKPA